MSMICILRQTEESDINHFLSNPDGIVDFLSGDEDEEMEERPEGEIDLDKAWHGIHFLLRAGIRFRRRELFYGLHNSHACDILTRVRI